MKKTIAFIALLITVSAFSATTNILDYAAVNGTSLGKTVNVSSVSITLPVKKWIFQNGALTNAAVANLTNAYPTILEWSPDSTTWIPYYTNYPTATNALTIDTTVRGVAVTTYYRARVVTTNSNPMGVLMQDP